MRGIGSPQFHAAVVAGGGGGGGGVAVAAAAVVAAAAAVHVAYVTAEFGAGFEDAEAVVLGPREFARTGKVVMVDWLALVVL